MRGATRLLAGSEDDFLRRLTCLTARRRLAPGMLGVGDDAAVLPGRPVHVVSVDLLVEMQHFRFDLLSPRELARRALEANLSDIAAMGARPIGSFLGLAWPASPGRRRLAGQLVAAFERAAAERAAPLLGGDTVRASAGAATLAITVVGAPWPGGPVLRSGGRPGDILVVTGQLGAAVVGLRLLERRSKAVRAASGWQAEAVRAYRSPRARLELAQLFARDARALMDLSDGLGLDLPRLAAASGCGFDVDAEAIPIHRAAWRFGGAQRSALRLALEGGEDYELIAAVPPSRLERARRAAGRLGCDLVAIGMLTQRPGGRLRLGHGRGGATISWPRRGWDPFAPGHIVSLDAGRPSRVGRCAPWRPRR